jgi:hypothetical protein
MPQNKFSVTYGYHDSFGWNFYASEILECKNITEAHGLSEAHAKAMGKVVGGIKQIENTTEVHH